MTHPDEKLKELGIELADVKPFHPAVALGVITEGNMLYCCGSTTTDPKWKGRVGDVYTTAEGYQAARECAIAQLAIAKSMIGDLGRIKRVVKVLGMVNAAPGFTETPQVIHGVSEFYFEIFVRRAFMLAPRLACRRCRVMSRSRSRRSSRSNPSRFPRRDQRSARKTTGEPSRLPGRRSSAVSYELLAYPHSVDATLVVAVPQHGTSTLGRYTRTVHPISVSDFAHSEYPNRLCRHRDRPRLDQPRVALMIQHIDRHSALQCLPRQRVRRPARRRVQHQHPLRDRQQIRIPDRRVLSRDAITFHTWRRHDRHSPIGDPRLDRLPKLAAVESSTFVKRPRWANRDRLGATQEDFEALSFKPRMEAANEYSSRLSQGDSKIIGWKQCRRQNLR